MCRTGVVGCFQGFCRTPAHTEAGLGEGKVGMGISPREALHPRSLEVEASRAAMVQLQPPASHTQDGEPDTRADDLGPRQADLGFSLSSATSKLPSTLGKVLSLSEAASSCLY